MGTFELALVRHGFSEGNEQGLLSGWSDVPLTQRGREELRELRRTAEYPVTERYYSSDLVRCRDTFEELYAGRAALDGLRPEFREIHFGSLENARWKPEEFARFFRAWLSGVRVADEESREEFTARVRGAVRTLAEQCRAEGVHSATVVTHSGVIKTLLVSLRGLPDEAWRTTQVPNGRGYALVLDETGTELLSCEAI